ncbi:hypothetical protein ITJ42_00115 [Clavibacter michiganensis subsp. phaseoli]|uniref:Uncharacterized protein n=1 Tax=Clavibacter phaseoli TaxID=1734031 RepID=A0A8I0S537_9MICO|nr:hypothetical protein [Clavibacter phaseoli]MBF4629617.1 hypothetical protein [Clavibacter phaseoli]
MVLIRRNVVLVLGAALALIGAGVTVLYFFQPWRTCSYEDSAAGCAMLDADAAVMVVAMVATLLGVILFLVDVLRWCRGGVR